ncbi:hypothetical protein KP509_03G006500 [Ceratopteris richardii]|uniref:Expansin-like EG45 domain-containing protein n=1 Tax=Ceratopteris richardii TaxID=49495 RepID=A0A8T2V146_CERRI|nr:hypothetical protein KP509_03G006500 [Ceratopteris richardii]
MDAQQYGTFSAFYLCVSRAQLRLESTREIYTQFALVSSTCSGDDSSQFPGDGNFAATSSSIYNGGATCGQYYTITCTGNGCNGGGPISVKIVDLCLGCAANQFDLIKTAFSNTVDMAVGVIDIVYSQQASNIYARGCMT